MKSRKRNIAPEIEAEIRRICKQSQEGCLTSTLRAEELYYLYPEDYERISKRVKDEETAKLNPLFKIGDAR